MAVGRSWRPDHPGDGIGAQTSATWRMPPPQLRRDAGEVEVRIWFDQTEPPVGQLWPLTASDGPAGDDAAPIEFAGWLGLLRALSDAIACAEGVQPEQ
jgi:hypothetical protein